MRAPPRIAIAVAALLACGLALAATKTPDTAALAARAQALRDSVGPQSQSLTEDRADFLRRQLLASLERRQDMTQSIRDVERLSQHPPRDNTPPPNSVLALDDVRRELQRLEAELDNGRQRRKILQEERDTAATMLTRKVGEERALVDAGADSAAREVAGIEVELIESSVAEIDQMIRLVDVQQAFAQAQHDAIARRLARLDPAKITVTARDAAMIEQRMQARQTELRRRMTVSAADRARGRAELQRADPATPPLRMETMKERLANADIELELAREALTNLDTERAVWQIAVRHYRDRDPQALVEARNSGPMLMERLEGRREFLRAMSDQILARTGALGTEIDQAPNAPDAADKRALLAVLEQRLQMVHRAQFDEGRVADLVSRIRADFDQSMRTTSFEERARFAWASLRDFA